MRMPLTGPASASVSTRSPSSGSITLSKSSTRCELAALCFCHCYAAMPNIHLCLHASRCPVRMSSDCCQGAAPEDTRALPHAHWDVSLHVPASQQPTQSQPLVAPQALDNMLQDKAIARPLNIVAHGFITGQYAATWSLAHPDAVAKLVLIDVPLSPEVRNWAHGEYLSAASLFLTGKTWDGQHCSTCD